MAMKKCVLLALISLMSQLHAVMPIRSTPEEAIRESLDYIWNTMFPMGSRNKAYRDEFFQLTVQKEDFDTHWHSIFREQVSNSSFCFNMIKKVRSLYEITEMKQTGSPISTTSSPASPYQLYTVTYRVKLKDGTEDGTIACEYSSFKVKQLDANSWQVCSWVSNIDVF